MGWWDDKLNIKYGEFYRRVRDFSGTSYTITNPEHSDHQTTNTEATNTEAANFTLKDGRL